MKMRVLSVVALLLAVLALPSPARAGEGGSALKNAKVEFYVSKAGKGGEQRLYPWRQIPNAVGTTCYGWRLRWTPFDGQMTVEERLLLPAAAPNWGADGDVSVAADRASSIKRVTVPGNSIYAANSWCVAQGDPPGRYRLELWHAGRKIARRTFVVR